MTVFAGGVVPFAHPAAKAAIRKIPTINIIPISTH